MAERKAFPLRIDPALWAAVERCATANLRSANAEIECLLREALKARGVKLAPPQPVKRGRPPKETDDG
ncbi:toxin-antitoxin system HicB family antitoxin [Sphingomonas humi]|uniref:Toxin-antitoxin system HicB family antitoxin n=1 Tax=Sphingomonas humi TaxID=335630 RepID=A0ABP7RLQ4_9SPHN